MKKAGVGKKAVAIVQWQNPEGWKPTKKEQDRIRSTLFRVKEQGIPMNQQKYDQFLREGFPSIGSRLTKTEAAERFPGSAQMPTPAITDDRV